jgi:hypothetical protein
VYVTFAVPLTAELSAAEVVGQYVVVWWMTSVTVVAELWCAAVVPVLDVVLEVDAETEVEVGVESVEVDVDIDVEGEVETDVEETLLEDEEVEVVVTELDELVK